MFRFIKNFVTYIKSILLAKAYKRVANDQQLSESTVKNVLLDFASLEVLHSPGFIATLHSLAKHGTDGIASQFLQNLSLHPDEVVRVLDAASNFIDMEFVNVGHLMSYNEYRKSVMDIISAVDTHLNEGNQIDANWLHDTIVNTSEADRVMLTALAWHIARNNANYKSPNKSRSNRVNAATRKLIIAEIQKGQKTGAEIAREFGFSTATISHIKTKLERKAKQVKQMEENNKEAVVATPERKDVAEDVAKVETAADLAPVTKLEAKVDELANENKKPKRRKGGRFKPAKLKK